MGGRLDSGPAGTIVGRDVELATIAAAFTAGSRLVTLTGLGGIGKTTIAVEHASRSPADSRAAPPVFVDLAPIGQPDDVLPTIAAALVVSGADSAELESNVAATLRQRPGLLILDNFEHLLAARGVIRRLIDGAGEGLETLVTSRVALGLDDELVLPIAPLPIPSSPEDLEAVDAGRLLIGRARARGGLRASEPDDAIALVDICRRLDGVPLALELAASWTRLLSPRAILRRLNERRLRLEEPDGGRHSTMDLVIETTLDLLGPDDRRLFESLCIFVAPFDEAGARAVGDRENVLDVIRRLETMSLVHAQVEFDGEPRFRILETVRVLGAGRLATRSDRESVERRFLDQAALRSQDAADALRDLRPGATLAWMSAEQPNLRAALALAMARGEADSAVQLAMTLATHGVRAGNARESLDRLRSALAMGPVAPGIRSEALCAIVNLCVMTREPADLTAMCREAVTLARTAGDERREARALVALGSYGPAEEAEQVLTTAIEFSTRIGYAWAALAAMDNLATSRADAGQWLEAFELFERSAAAAVESRDTVGIGHTWTSMADLAAILGRQDDAYQLAVRGSEANRVAWPQSATMAWSLAMQATAEQLTGRRTAAFGTLVEACETAEAAESSAAVSDVLEAAVVVLADDEPALAARIGGLLEAVGAERGGPRAASPTTIAALARSRAVMGGRRFEREQGAGRDADDWILLDEVKGVAMSRRRSASRVDVEFGSLTRREVDVLWLLGQGRTDAQIATELGMSPKTASVHVTNIKSKLGVETRIDAAIRARELLSGAEGTAPS